jgi:hypothetical protein
MHVTRSAFSTAHSSRGNDEVVLTGVKALVLQMDQKAPCRMYRGMLRQTKKTKISDPVQSTRAETT